MLDFVLNHQCHVNMVLTPGAIWLDAFILIATVILLFLFSRTNKHFFDHYMIIALGIFTFEMFTSPLWINEHLGSAAYFYQDISWVLTFGWATFILSVILLVDNAFKNLGSAKRFLIYLLSISVIGVVLESLLVFLGIRSYSPEVINVLSGVKLLEAPIETLYYIPVFTALIIGFYKYWAIIIDEKPVVPRAKGDWGKALLMSVVGVLLFELMVEPMAINSNMPEWSYIYKDISFIMTGTWIILIWLSIKLVDNIFKKFNLKQKFGMYFLVGGFLSIVLESFYVANGYRQYSESVVDNFMGVTTPLTHLPLEIWLAMPMYTVLMISFVKYWEFVINKNNI